MLGDNTGSFFIDRFALLFRSLHNSLWNRPFIYLLKNIKDITSIVKVSDGRDHVGHSKIIK